LEIKIGMEGGRGVLFFLFKRYILYSDLICELLVASTGTGSAVVGTSSICCCGS
jgi:hypothetical protein